MHEDKANSDSRLKREQGFKEFYEITDSKFMFKFNPHPENASEE
jgi:hypothetical protein